MSVRIFFQLLALAAILHAGAARAAATLTLQEGLEGYVGTKDTFIDWWASSFNFGTGGGLIDLADTDNVLIRFTIFRSEGGPLPDGSTIQSATLSLYQGAGRAKTYEAHRLLKDWAETEATWERASTERGWTVAGANGIGSDIQETPDGSGVSPASEGWLNIPVTAGVTAIAAGAPNHGWRLGPTSPALDETDYTVFYSKESAYIAPKLTIAYEPPPSTDAQTLYFVHPDHLGTPRLIADGQGTPVWTWDNTEPFGNAAPNPNPTGTQGCSMLNALVVQDLVQFDGVVVESGTDIGLAVVA